MNAQYTKNFNNFFSLEIAFIIVAYLYIQYNTTFREHIKQDPALIMGWLLCYNNQIGPRSNTDRYCRQGCQIFNAKHRIFGGIELQILYIWRLSFFLCHCFSSLSFVFPCFNFKKHYDKSLNLAVLYSQLGGDS